MHIENLDELRQLAYKLAPLFRPGDVVSLVGDLGAGKTTLVQYISENLGLQEEYITSPTFSIVNIYEGDYTIYHLDLYRLESPLELEQLDFERYFYPDGVSFIEWASRGEDYLPDDMIEIIIEKKEEAREIIISPNSERGREILGSLE